VADHRRLPRDPLLGDQRATPRDDARPAGRLRAADHVGHRALRTRSGSHGDARARQTQRAPGSRPARALMTEAELDDLLSKPRADTSAALAACPGDIVILGAGGKMGPTLARMARRAAGDDR